MHILGAVVVALGALSLGAYSSGLLSGTLSIMVSLATASVISGGALLRRMSHGHRQPVMQRMEREQHDDLSHRSNA